MTFKYFFFSFFHYDFSYFYIIFRNWQYNKDLFLTMAVTPKHCRNLGFKIGIDQACLEIFTSSEPIDFWAKSQECDKVVSFFLIIYLI